MNTPNMTLKLVLPCEPNAAKLTPNHRTHEPANSIRTMLRAIMPRQIAPTFGDVSATLFEAREPSLVPEMGFLVLEQCVGVAIRYPRRQDLGPSRHRLADGTSSGLSVLSRRLGIWMIGDWCAD